MNKSYLRAIGISSRSQAQSFALVWCPGRLLRKKSTLAWSRARCSASSRTKCIQSTKASSLTLSRLDPHSSYMTEAEFRESMKDINGEFGGVGLKFRNHNEVPTVISPIKTHQRHGQDWSRATRSSRSPE